MPAGGAPPDGPPVGAVDADARLAALEAAVAALRQEVAALRAGAPAPPHAAPAPATYAPVTYAGLPRAARVHARTGDRARERARAWAAELGVPGLPADRAGLETLVGRYGAVAVGALVLLMGVGAFLTWAVENFTLAPAARVVLGLAGAAALAALGEWLRRREGARRFGETLLALALAVVHVDAWAAGPYLHVVSPGTALAAAAVASAALTALAWRSRQQSLFVVGVGGALLAPFVSGAGEAAPAVRAVYGWTVLTAGLLALVRGGAPLRAGVGSDAVPDPAERPWRAAARLLAIGAAAYAAAQLNAGVELRTSAAATDWWALPVVRDRDLPAVFALACAGGSVAAALWMAGSRRPDRASRGVAGAAATAVVARLAVAELATVLVVLLATAAAAVGRTPTLVGYALAATLGAQLVAALPAAVRAAAGRRAFGWRRHRAHAPTATFAALGLPLGFLAAALLAYHALGSAGAAGLAALWTALSAAAAALAWRRGDVERLGPHVAAAGFASALVPLVGVSGHDALRLALLGGHAAATSALFARLPGRTPARDGRPLLALAPPLLVLAGASVWGALQLEARPAFGYTPFLTAPSAAVATVVLGWVACAAVVWRAGDALLPRGERAAVVGVAAAVAVLWGREELAHVGAPDVATFLLVGYWATAGLVALALGRARRIAAARQAGLALALYAALKAIVEVSQLDAVALRVGSYLLVGAFLLGVGYWYRAGGTPTGDVTTAVPGAAGVVHDVP